MKKLALLILFLPLTLLLGCSQRLGDFTVISTKNVDIGTNYLIVQKNAEGYSTKQIIVLFPTGYPDIKSAVDDVLNKYDGQILGDAVLEHSSWYIPFIYGETTYKIRGDVYAKAKKLKTMNDTELKEKVNNDYENANEYYSYINGKIEKINKEDVDINLLTNKLEVINN